MKPLWTDAPAWALWLAMDASGVWHWFEREPGCAAQDFRALGGSSQIAGRSAKPRTWAPYLEARPMLGLQSNHADLITTQHATTRGHHA